METDQFRAERNVLDADAISNSLGRSLFAEKLVFHETLNSTNSLAKDLAARGAPEGTLVLTEEQTAGRGRMGRRWLSPAGENLLFSVIFRPPMQAEQVFSLTMVFALATLDGVKEVSGLSPMIKWPNDLYVGDKKLGGILTEFSVLGKFVEFVVLGLGLNVNWNPDCDDSMLYPATSILAGTGKRVSRERLLVILLRRLESYYQEVVIGNLNKFYKRWNDHSMLLKKRVEIKMLDGKILGSADRIDKNGALIVLDDHGVEHKIVCGDVSVREILL